MKRLFILDDDEDILDILHHILCDKYELHFKKNAVDVAGEIIDFKPDLIVMDNFLGTTNATEVMSRLSNQGTGLSVPVILFSASPNIEATAKKLGLQGYLQKPSSIKEIRSYIQEMLS